MAAGIDVEMGTWLDTFSGDLRYSLNRFAGDGTTTQWPIQFAGGYIDSTHVKAYSVNLTTGVSTPRALTFISTYLVEITPAVPATERLVIYRDTPKATPLVNFVDGAVYNERNMDKVVSQSVFVSAEVTDSASVALEAAIAASGEAGEVSTIAIAAAATATTKAAEAVESALAALASEGTAAAAAAAAEAAAGSIDVSTLLTKAGNLSGIADAAAARTTLGLGNAATGTIGSEVQGYDAATAKTDADQAWTGSQRATPVTDNDGSFDMDAALDFNCTPTAGFTLTFTNITQGQRGCIYLVNGSNYAIAAAATSKVTSTLLDTISATGEYWLSYWSPDGTNVLVTGAGDFA